MHNSIYFGVIMLWPEANSETLQLRLHVQLSALCCLDEPLLIVLRFALQGASFLFPHLMTMFGVRKPAEEMRGSVRTKLLDLSLAG